MATIGADPELFIRNKHTGTVTSAVGLIGGTKSEPLPIPGLASRDGYTMQEDNVMVEFNIPPATSSTRFSRSIRTALDELINVVRTTRSDLEVDVAYSTRLFPQSELCTEQAQMFGCSPDFNAHRQGQAWPTITPEALIEDGGAWRFAGGHIHLGYEVKGIPEYVVAALCDVWLGLPSIGLDEQGMRRELYGQAGRYRPTPYGIEYRTLSNFWIWSNSHASYFGRQALRLCEYISNPKIQEALQSMYAEIPWNDVQRAINTEDQTVAHDLLQYIRHEVGMEV